VTGESGGPSHPALASLIFWPCIWRSYKHPCATSRLLLTQSPSRALPRTHLGERAKTPQTTSLSHPGTAHALAYRVRAI